VRALVALAVYGRGALTDALVTGQYEFPKGLFFGGRQPSQTHMILERCMKSWIGRAAAVVHLDVHTGLGSWGTYKLLVDYPVAADQRERLTRWFGHASFVESDPSWPAYQARGSFGPWCVSRGFAPDYTFAFLEFGTYRDLAIVSGLRAENQAHFWAAGPHDAATIRAKARLRELFCPASPGWRARCLQNARDVMGQAVEALRYNT
jgi:hypothetical protein